VLCFILKLLTLKAKQSWLDGSFNDLLRIFSLVASKAKYSASQHISSKEACQPVHDGCGKNSCMLKSLYFISW
jgi:hypothetical protein